MRQLQKKRRKLNHRLQIPNINFKMDKLKAIILLALILVIVVVIIISGIGVKVTHKSPEGVVKSLIQAYQKESEKAVRDCFGFDKKEKLDEVSQEEITYNLDFFRAHKAKEIVFKECASLGSFNGYELVYAIYDYEIQRSDLEKKNEESVKEESKEEKKQGKMQAPAISLYFVQKKDNEYFVVPAKDVTEDMSNVSKEEYTKFIKTDIYKDYEDRYETFLKENEDYESLLEESLKEIKKEIKKED